MTVTTISGRRVRRPVREAATHIFTVGQQVRLKRRFSPAATMHAEVYQVTARLPQTGGSPQYRIRNDDERHERVVTQDDLEPVRDVRSGDDATLIGRTFGDGQGTKT